MATKILGGYTGKILRVDLSNNNISVETLDEPFCRKYIGGTGFIAYYLWEELRKGVDPLGPENKLIFALGPVTGVPISGSGRHCIGAKSPLTGGFAKSEIGGYWGAELKHAGYDAIIIEGKAKKPVYLWVHDGEASIKDASHLWGQNTKETQQAIRDEQGDNLIRVASIGPAGENMVRFACVINDLRDASGRGGTGAVMGSKNLKAIGVRGHGMPAIADPEYLKEIRKWLLDNPDLWRGFHKYGTGAAMEAGATSGNLPIRNFNEGVFPDASKIGSETVKDTIRIGMESCYACSVRCKKVVKVEGQNPVDSAYGGPEYETLAALGSNCGVNDLKAIARGNQLCNAYSLDTISTGVVVSFAMECFEKGLLTIEDTKGIELKFGNADAMMKTIEAIARREGVGNLLAEGTARAAQKIGGSSQDFAMNVKGLEIPMHDPRLKAGLGLGYAVNPHGADHMDNMHDTMYSKPGRQIDRVNALGIEPLPADELGPRKAAMFRNLQLSRVALDSLLICMFVPYETEQAARILSAVTGWKSSIAETLKVAERTLTLARLFNLREGFTAADDKLPKRFFQPKANGALSDKMVNAEDLERAKSYYYSLMGWDAHTGVPTSEKLEELGIQ